MGAACTNCNACKTQESKLEFESDFVSLFTMYRGIVLLTTKSTFKNNPNIVPILHPEVLIKNSKI